MQLPHEVHCKCSKCIGSETPEMFFFTNDFIPFMEVWDDSNDLHDMIGQKPINNLLQIPRLRFVSFGGFRKSTICMSWHPPELKRLIFLFGCTLHSGNCQCQLPWHSNAMRPLSQRHTLDIQVIFCDLSRSTHSLCESIQTPLHSMLSNTLVCDKMIALFWVGH